MEIRLNVDDEFMEKLRKKLKKNKASQIALDALTLLNWAADEAGKNRVVLSSTQEGDDVHTLVMPSLQQIEVTKG